MELVAIRRNSVQDCEPGASRGGPLAQEADVVLANTDLQPGFARRLDERFEAGGASSFFSFLPGARCAVNLGQEQFPRQEAGFA